jgi:cell division protein FtsB
MRLLMLALTLSLVLLQARLWVSEEGMREVWRLRSQVAERTEENQALALRNSALDAEVQDLKQGFAAVEERARAEMGMIAPGETFFQITPPSARQAEAR